MSLRIVLIEIPKLPLKSVDAPLGTEPLGVRVCQESEMLASAAVVVAVGAAAMMLSTAEELMKLEYFMRDWVVGY